MVRKICLGLLALCFVTTSATIAFGYDYIGAPKCKICHKGEAKGKIYEIWSESKHAKSLEVLKVKGEDKNPACLACHVTGYGKPTGYGADSTKFEALGNVGCEVCHGPGSAYSKMAVMQDPAKAKEAGLLTPDEKTCLTCHNEKSPTFNKDKPFKFAESYKMIEHHAPKKTQ
ncbi:MAG: cytochrome c family protein [bacterium]|nr:cytochrome c family protein [bacterium]